MTASDSAKLDACDQSCLRMICGVHWSQHVTNDEIRRRTGCLLANTLPNGASSCSSILRALIRLLIPDVPSQPQHRGTGAGRVEGHAIRGDRPSRLMWPRSTLACTPHGAGRRTELSGELQLFVPRYRSVVGGWKEEGPYGFLACVIFGATLYKMYNHLYICNSSIPISLNIQ